MKRVLSVALFVMLAFVLSPASVARAGFCGENGVIRFSFAEGPDLVPVTKVEPGENGVTMIDLYAWLTDVEPLEKDGEAFLGTAALELQLVIEGAEGFILKQDFPQPTRQIGQTLGQCIVGYYPGLKIENGAVQLVHWQIMFQGRPENVVFRLDPGGLMTCERTEGCPGSGVSALYTGTEDSGMIGAIFGAGYQPAYLNFEGEPDLEPIRGKVTWRDVGEFQHR